MEGNALLTNDYSLMIGVFALMVIVIGVLAFVIVMQTRKLNEANKPRYGFLGKPLVAVFFLILSIGSFGLVYYASQNSSDVDNVSADKELSFEIMSKSLGSNTYEFKALPKINNKEWGNDGDRFSVYWTITNTSSETRIELDLTSNNTGGINVELSSGKNIISATLFYNNQSVKREIVIEL